ncbi:MAG: HNH endonuclease [Bacteroidales bacterium]|nr:HNH endonuclease [Bacteroidales bacterium]
MDKRKLRKIKDEIWKKIPLSDGKYEISNYGRVKSYYKDTKNGKIIKQTKNKNLYIVSLRINSKSKAYMVHKLTAELFVSKEIDEQNVVIHLDANPKNNYYKNLKWLTQFEKQKIIRKKLMEKRKNNEVLITYSKLKDDDVKLLKSMLKKGVKQNVIAKLFCISEMQVTRIKRGENWSHIKVPDDK